MTIAGRPRRRFLTVIAGLLAITAIVGWGLKKRSEYQTAKEQAAIRRIEAVGGGVREKTENPMFHYLPDWMLRWDFIRSIAVEHTRTRPEVICLGITAITDDEFRNLKIEDLPSVTGLEVGSSKMTGRSLAELSKLPRLDHLQIENMKIVEDANLLNVTVLPSIKSLYLGRSNVSNRGTANLATLFPNLKYLHLMNGATITDDALHCLRHCESLVLLDLNASPITETGIKELHGYRHLWRLKLRGAESTTIDNMRELVSTLPKCEYVEFTDWSQKCPECELFAIRQLGSAGINRTVFWCGHVQTKDLQIQE